jgi:hypothetical protein
MSRRGCKPGILDVDGSMDYYPSIEYMYFEPVFQVESYTIGEAARCQNWAAARYRYSLHMFLQIGHCHLNRLNPRNSCIVSSSSSVLYHSSGEHQLVPAKGQEERPQSGRMAYSARLLLSRFSRLSRWMVGQGSGHLLAQGNNRKAFLVGCKKTHPTLGCRSLSCSTLSYQWT